MLRVRRTGTAMLILIAAVGATTACGAGEADEGGSGGIGPQVSMALELTGSTALSGEQTAAAPSLNGTLLSSCAEYAKGGRSDDGKVLYAIAGLLDGPVDGRKVTVELWIDDYAGPGTYPKDQLVAPGSEPSIAVDGTVFGTWPDSTGSEVVTDGRGGGRWTFTKLAATGPGGLPGDAVSGSVTWTCREP